MMHILHVVGARPNFMKAAPVIAALGQRNGFRQTLVHTGQHYDANMSDIFFGQLGIPKADFNLEIGSGSHARQTAQIMSRFEPVVLEQQPDLVLVYGDVNSTRPVTITAGTNVLVGQNMGRLKEEAYRILAGTEKKGSVPPLWDGRTGERIADVVQGWLAGRS